MGRREAEGTSPKQVKSPLKYSKLGQSAVNAVRFAEVVQVFVRHGFADLVRRTGLHHILPRRMAQGLSLTGAPPGEPATFGSRVCAALSDLGPTWVKFGQILSTRPDLVGTGIAVELSQLQDNVSPMPFDAMLEVIETALGNTLESVYSEFDRDPVASASISQVYRARLRSGEAVAVKVQRPGAEKKIESDLGLMRQLAEWIETHLEEPHWFDPVALLDEFERSIHRELDFEVESRVIDQFRANFDGVDYVFVPKVYHACTRSRMLTMDWIDGVRIDATHAYGARECDPKIVAARGCEILCQMIFDHRLFHADPHPGNAFITRANQIAFLDLGMAGHLERADVGAIADLLYAMFQGDARGCVESILVLTRRGGADDREMFEHEIAEFLAFEAPAIIGGGHVAKGIERAIQILRRYNLELAPRFALLLKALMTIEMVGRRLDPEVDMAPIMRPFVEKVIKERFEPIGMMREAQFNANALLKLSRQLPGDIGFLLQQLRRGKIRFQVHHEHLENLASTIDRSSSRNTVGIIVAALIVGSSLLITTDTSARHVGLGGFIVAGVLGLMLVVSILWTRRF